MSKIIHGIVKDKMESRYSEQDKHQREKKRYENGQRIKEIVNNNYANGL